MKTEITLSFCLLFALSGCGMLEYHRMWENADEVVPEKNTVPIPIDEDGDGKFDFAVVGEKCVDTVTGSIEVKPIVDSEGNEILVEGSKEYFEKLQAIDETDTAISTGLKGAGVAWGGGIGAVLAAVGGWWARRKPLRNLQETKEQVEVEKREFAELVDSIQRAKDKIDQTSWEAMKQQLKQTQSPELEYKVRRVKEQNSGT
jgi:hypothetical protein